MHFTVREGLEGFATAILLYASERLFDIRIFADYAHVASIFRDVVLLFSAMFLVTIINAFTGLGMIEPAKSGKFSQIILGSSVFAVLGLMTFLLLHRITPP